MNPNRYRAKVKGEDLWLHEHSSTFVYEEKEARIFPSKAGAKMGVTRYNKHLTWRKLEPVEFEIEEVQIVPVRK